MRRPEVLAEQLAYIPGVSFHPHLFRPQPEHPLLPGIRMTVTNPLTYRPLETSVHLLTALTQRYGTRRVWLHASARPAFFDQLFGTDSVRLAIMDQAHPETIIKAWQPGLSSFKEQRAKALLYK